MDISETIRALRGVGVYAVPENATTLRTSDGRRIKVSRFNRTPSPSNVDLELRDLKTGERILFQVKRITPSLRATAEADNRIIVATDDQLIIDGQLDQPADEQPNTKPRRGPRPYGEFAVARALLSPPRPRALVQAEIASRAGIRQPAVSAALRKLGPLVERRRVGWQPADPAALFDYAATEYPGAGGITTYWWHDADLRTQAATLSADAEGALVGGDLAASEISGWRKPEHVLLYLPTGIDPTRHGFVAAERGKHTVELVVPEDKTLWPSAEAFFIPNRTDPITTVFDVRRTGYTGDQDEAAQRVRDHVLAAYQ